MAQKFLTQAREDTAAGEQQIQQWLQQAWEAVRPRVEGGSTDPTHYLLGAQASLKLGDFARAGELVDRFVELAPECSGMGQQVRYAAWAEMYNAAITSYQAGEQDSALAYFESASSLYPDPRSLVNAATLRRQRGEADTAAALYRKAIAVGAGGEHAEQVRQAVASLAEIRMQAGNTEQAMQIYNDYLADNPQDALVTLNYAQALAEQGQTDSAQALFTSLLGREDLSFEEWSELGISLFRGESYGHSVTAFRKARERQPLNKETMENLASALVQSEQFEAAAALGDTLVEWYPYDAQNLSVVLRAYGQLGQRQKAEALADRIQNSPLRLHQLGLMERTTGQYVIQGIVENVNGQQGATHTFVVELLNPQRQVVKTEEVAVELPAQGERESFRTNITSGAPAVSFRYHKKESGG